MRTPTFVQMERGEVMNREELDKILENHKHWIYKDCEGWEDMRADLSGANLYRVDLYHANLSGAILCDTDLRGVNLRGANLYRTNFCEADLCEANLCGADLWEASLSGANLCGANLCGASLYGASLYGAKLWGANLSGANLCGVDLRSATLNGADLRKADLHGADLRKTSCCDAEFYEADLRWADFRGANFNEADFRGADLLGAIFWEEKNTPFIPMACPEEGVFIGYKKADNLIVKLEICKDARRSSATGRKCRCDKAKVLSITELDGSPTTETEVSSDYDENFIYKVGEIVEEPNFCEDRFEECAKGIHFFINRQEAVEY